MKILKEIDENGMISVFLRGELGSERWSDAIFSLLEKYKVERNLIDNPNLQDEGDNEVRKKILSDFRGYGENKHLFYNFPNDVKWMRVSLNKEDLGKVLFIDWDYWKEVTLGTRSPQVLATRILSGELAEDKEVLRFKRLADSLKSGVKFTELILVAEDEHSKLVVLEGHVRLTAYFLVLEYIPNEIEVIIGFSKEMSKWDNY